MDNVNFDAKTDWKLNDAVMPQDANRWEQGIDDVVKLANNLNETKIDESKANEELAEKADIDLKNTRMLSNCLIKSKSGVLTSELGKKGNYNIVGSPTISQNEILYNISANNYVYMDINAPIASKNLLFKTKIHTPQTFASANIMKAMAENGMGVIINMNSAGQVLLYLSSNSTSWNIANATATGFYLVADTDYWLKLYWTGYQYILAYSEDGITYKVAYALNSTLPICATTKAYLGINSDGSTHIFTGQIDLKEVQIQIDGEKVFGGVNAIPVRDVTVQNGIASGFNYSNGSELILEGTDIVPSKSLEIVVKFRVSSLATRQMIIDSINGTTFQLIVNTDGSIAIWVGNGSSYFITEYAPYLVVAAGTDYWFKLVWDGKYQYIAMLSQDGINYTSGIPYYSTSVPIVVKTNVSMGYDRGYGHQVNGHIDLSGTYIKVDGAVVVGGANYFNINASASGGVISDFGVKKCVQTDKTLPKATKNYIYTIKIHTPSTWDRSRNWIMGWQQKGKSEGPIGLYTNTAGALFAYANSSGSSSSWDIMNAYELRSERARFTLPTDTDVWVRLIKTTKFYVAQYSLDGINYIGGRILPTAAFTGPGPVLFGNLNSDSSEFFGGSIDLKETSFKIDGDLSFDNGVNLITVNEAKVENGKLIPYLQNMSGAIIPEQVPETAANTWDITMGIHTADTSLLTSTAQFFLGTATTNGQRYYVEANKFCIARGKSKIMTGVTAVTPNTDYWIKITFDGAKYYMYSLLDDGSYSLDTLPGISSWAKEGELSLNTDYFASNFLSLSFSYENITYWKGTIDLTKVRFLRNGEVFWQYNGKDNDNIDSKNFEGWVFNGKSEQNKFTLSGDPVWEWNGRSSFNTSLDGGNVWDLIQPVTGSIVVKKDNTFLLENGEENGFMKVKTFTTPSDINVPIPYVQGGLYAAYVKADGTVGTIEKSKYLTSSEKYGALICFFGIGDYVLTEVTEHVKTELLKREDLYQIIPVGSQNIASCPNYEKAMSVTNPMTIPMNGAIIARCSRADWSTLNFYVNGYLLFARDGGEYSGAGQSMFCVVKKGDVISWSGNPSMINFIPGFENEGV